MFFKLSSKIAFVFLKKSRGRLISSILLAAFTFALIALLLTTVFYDENEVFARIAMQGFTYTDAQKYYTTHDSSYDEQSVLDKALDLSNGEKDVIVKITEEEYAEISDHSLLTLRYNRAPAPYSDSSVVVYQNTEIASKVYAANTYLEMTEESLEFFGYTVKAGRLPQSADEAAISLCLFEVFEELGYFLDEETAAISSFSDIIGKSYLDGLTITGVIDTHCAGHGEETRSEDSRISHAVYRSSDAFASPAPAEGELAYSTGVTVGEERYHFSTVKRASQTEYFTGSGNISSDMFLLPASLIGKVYSTIPCRAAIDGKSYSDYGELFYEKTEGLSAHESFLVGKELCDRYGLAAYLKQIEIVDTTPVETEDTLRLGGFVYGEEDSVFTSDSFYELLYPYYRGIYPSCIILLPRDFDELVALSEFLNENGIKPKSSPFGVSYSLQIADLAMLKRYMSVVSVLMGIFIVILLSTFLVSNYEKRLTSMGILYATGVGRKEIAWILFMQAFILCMGASILGLCCAAAIWKISALSSSPAFYIFHDLSAIITINAPVCLTVLGLGFALSLVMSFVQFVQIKRKPPLNVIKKGREL